MHGFLPLACAGFVLCADSAVADSSSEPGTRGRFTQSTVGRRGFLLGLETGSPNTSLELLYGVGTRTDLGLKASLLLGYEQFFAPFPGLAIQGEIRSAVGGPPEGPPRLVLTVGLGLAAYLTGQRMVWLPVGASVSLIARPSFDLVLLVELPLAVGLAGTPVANASLLVGPGLEWHAWPHVRVYANARAGAGVILTTMGPGYGPAFCLNVGLAWLWAGST